MFMVHSKKFQIEQVTFTTSDLNDFYDPWVDKTRFSCMTNVVIDGSTSVIMQPITFEKICIIIIIGQWYILCKHIYIGSIA